jgi:hypothetical protein
VPAFRRICSASLSSFYISAQRALELAALDETQNLRARRSRTEFACLLERANLSLLTPAGKHIRTFQEDLYCDNWPTRMITKPAIIKTARPRISPTKPSTQSLGGHPPDPLAPPVKQGKNRSVCLFASSICRRYGDEITGRKQSHHSQGQETPPKTNASVFPCFTDDRLSSRSCSSRLSKRYQ